MNQKQSLDKAEILKKRALILKTIRRFFDSKKFFEIETPQLVFSPGLEPHIYPMEVMKKRINDGREKNFENLHSSFLHTSPEFSMKKILAYYHKQGLDKIYQICHCFRFEPMSDTHLPEFTMLEWYRTHSNYFELMNDVEELFEAIAYEIYNSLEFFSFNNEKQNLKRPWIRLSCNEAFQKFCGIKLTDLLEIKDIARYCYEKGHCSKELYNENYFKKSDSWNTFFFLIMLNEIEPKLKELGSPVILYDFPESLSALSNLYQDENGFTWAKRFEVYANGLEIANAFDELIDFKTQRLRFEKDMLTRFELYGESMPLSPIDDEFINALKLLPPSSGIALGVDRLIMYFLGVPKILDVVSLPPFLS
jgi:lysyl-tRNA synthetase class 2